MIYSPDIVKKRILIVGSNGLLGQHLISFYAKNKNVQLLGCSVEASPLLTGYDYVTCDITKREKLKKIIYDFYPDFIINAAAFTNVDLSETEREKAWKINVKGVEYLAEFSMAIDAHLIHISTDYVFDGINGPYSETDKPHPLSYYARTKLASENALRISGAIFTIIRANVLYGIAELGNGKVDFVSWVIKSINEGKEIRIVTDQISNPTFVEDLVQVINKVIEYRRQGIYHVGGREFISRNQFTNLIAEFFRLDKSLIKPITTVALKQPAKRPLKSGLLTLKAETELGFKPHTYYESFEIMRKEM
jgi:dTDP-4-dehydrorhamnose reductase